MALRSRVAAVLGLALYLAIGSPGLFALNPGEVMTQYTHAVWTQSQGLPADAILAITQTTDGYLWIGTHEGLTRFDGYDFVTFTSTDSPLPENSVTALAAGSDGSLWIGTANGLTQYRNHRFKTFTTADGLPSDVITALVEDHQGSLWIIAGTYLSRFDGGKLTNYPMERLLPVQAARTIYEDRQHTIWVGGAGGLLKISGDKIIPVPSRAEPGNIVSIIAGDSNNNLWIAGSKGLVLRTSDGKLRAFDSRDGLPPNRVIDALWADRDGNLWVGTTGGLSRFDGRRFLATPFDHDHDMDWVRCLFEDREGDLWVGMNSGLNRFNDAAFTVYGRAEGLPGDEPTAVHQDRRGEIWIGYHSEGLVAFHQGKPKVFTTRDGLAGNAIVAIHESRDGDLLISTTRGLSRMHDGKFSNYVVPDPLERSYVFDAVEDRHERIWLATPSGVYQMNGSASREMLPGGPVRADAHVVLAEGSGGEIWVGSYKQGLWQIKDGRSRHFTTSNGLGSDQIRSLYQDPDGTLWVGTFGGGLNAFRDGAFARYTSRDGLLSNNIAHIDDDLNGALWLSTPRGICRVSRAQLRDFDSGRIRVLSPMNYGVADGLRSAQVAKPYLGGGGGTRTRDGRLWFPTGRGLAVINPVAEVAERAPVVPIVHLVEVTAGNQTMDPDHYGRLNPGAGRIQFKYAAIHLSAPERVRYEVKLDGLDNDWTPVAARSAVSYPSLPHGKYRLVVRASAPLQSASEASFAFEVLPFFYERPSFYWICAVALAGLLCGFYAIHLRRIRSRVVLVLEERARISREIHDTLAQGFVGVSAQLDALAIKLNLDDGPARRHLTLAQRMVRHSLTEARRSVADLRAPDLEGGVLASALATGARRWTSGRGIPVEVSIPDDCRELPHDTEQQLLRIAQEAITNAVKHATPKQIWLQLQFEPRKLILTIKDDGLGFEPPSAFDVSGGHFGLLGMLERAERLGGELCISSQPGRGTQVRLSLPLPSEGTGKGTRGQYLLGMVKKLRPV